MRKLQLNWQLIANEIGIRTNLFNRMKPKRRQNLLHATLSRKLLNYKTKTSLNLFKKQIYKKKVLNTSNSIFQ